MNGTRAPGICTGFARFYTQLPEHEHIEKLIDIPGKKIYLNRAAREGANVVQVRFSLYGTEQDRTQPLRRRQTDRP